MKAIHKKLFELKKLTGRVVKNKENPFHKSNYADLNSVIDATEPAFEQLGLLYIDRLTEESLISQLIDIDTGESIESRTALLLPKQDMQALGSAITYARRFARLTICGLMAVDDDGSMASGLSFAKPRQIKEINELILYTKTDTNKFLQVFHVDSIKNLREDAAVQAIKTLNIKKEKMGESK